MLHLHFYEYLIIFNLMASSWLFGKHFDSIDDYHWYGFIAFILFLFTVGPVVLLFATIADRVAIVWKGISTSLELRFWWLYYFSDKFDNPTQEMLKMAGEYEQEKLKQGKRLRSFVLRRSIKAMKKRMKPATANDTQS